MGISYRRAIGASELANFYVDPDTGDDNFSGTSPDKAFRTWAPVNAMGTSDLGPGKVVRQKRGTITRTALTCPTSGTAGSPIVFGAYGSARDLPLTTGSAAAVGIASSWTLSGSEYRITLSGSTFAGTYIFWTRFGAIIPLAKGTYGSLTVFQYCMSGTTLSINIGRAPDHFDVFEVPQGTNAIIADGKSYIQFKGIGWRYGSVNGMQLANTTACDNIVVDGCEAAGNIGDLFNAAVNATNCTVKNSWFHDTPGTGGDGISFHSANSAPSSCTIEDCLFQRIGKNGISNDQLATQVIRRNRFEAANCVIYTSATGTPGTTQIYRNVFWGDIPGSSGGTYPIQLTPASGCTIYVYHNTLVAGLSANAAWRGIASFPATGGTNVIKNNIIRGVYNIGIYHNGTGTTTEDYNLVHQATTRYSGLSAGANSLNSDPLFVNEATGNFALLTGSPAKNAGVVLSGFNDDYFGAAPDMGAFERMVA